MALKPKDPKVTEPDQKLAPPSDREVATIRDAAVRVNNRKRPVSVRVRTTSATAPKKVEIAAPYDDPEGWKIRLADAFGTCSGDFVGQQLGTLIENSQASGPVNEQRVCSMLAAIGGVQPKDELEAMLAVQMATTHAFAMDSMRRAAGAEVIPQLEANGNMATKMMRTFVLQVETLAKLRRGGEQRVIVQHLNVNGGGQAIVGAVQAGGGVASKSGEQPHAKQIAHAPVAPLWSENQECEREPVPVAGDAER
jgi:hypothetical protein